MSETLAGRADFLGRPPSRRYTTTAPLPVLGKCVRLQSLTERELSRHQMAPVASDGRGRIRARIEDADRRLIVLCVVDEQGGRVFSDGDAEALAELDSADVEALARECWTHVRATRPTVEKLEKNSDATPAADSSTS